MKSNRLILLVVVGILLIAGATVFTLTKNNVKATPMNCPECNAETDTFYCGSECPECGETISHQITAVDTCEGECQICGYTEYYHETTYRDQLR